MAPSGGEFQEDLLHDLQVFTSKVSRQSAEQGRLLGRHPLAVQVIPIRHSDPAAVAAADCLQGIGACEDLNIPADGPL